MLTIAYPARYYLRTELEQRPNRRQPEWPEIDLANRQPFPLSYHPRFRAETHSIASRRRKLLRRREGLFILVTGSTRQMTK